MTKTAHDSPSVRLTSEGIRIDGKPEILLCASLFYFRIPRVYWKERMEQLISCGYNCIDVYFPWNYHEVSCGEWEFSGEKDAGEFLRLAADLGLWVVARPGPYICSEWDGGGLPAYLFAESDVLLRDNNPAFLAHVSRWFGQILPILQKYQAGAGGTVICMQLDNELDFYDCRDPKGYISALRDLARGYGIQVPLIACAGQGGLIQASGLAKDVIPTCNFYPDRLDSDLEEKVLHYHTVIGEMGYPLLVTETNRDHFLLRRLLSCGTKLLGPYLQVSGTDFGFTNSTNNWGAPLAFLTSDYDFAGMVSPEGHLREEASEARLLGRLIAAYGSALAESQPVVPLTVSLEGDSGSHMIGPFGLQLSGGGLLLFLSSLCDRDKEIAVCAHGERYPREGTFKLKKGCSVALPVLVPLQSWNIEGTLLYATAELFMAKLNERTTALAFHTDSRAEIALKLQLLHYEAPEHVKVETNEDSLVLSIDVGKFPEITAIELELLSGQVLKIFIMNRMKALSFDGFDGNGLTLKSTASSNIIPASIPSVDWTVQPLDAGRSMAEESPINCRRADFLEKSGILRGYAWYETTIKSVSQECIEGFLIRQASDVVSLYAGGVYAGTVVPGGSSAYVALNDARMTNDRFAARVEVWGHSNFDDARLPGLRLNAMKGLSGAAAITAVKDISRNWKVYRAGDRKLQGGLTDTVCDDRLWPVVNFGGWLSPDHPAFEYYRRTFKADQQADSWTVHFSGMQAHARLYVNGQDAGDVSPFDPYVDITPYIIPGSTVTLAVFLERVFGLPAGKVVVYEGTEAVHWTITATEEQGLWKHAESFRDRSKTTALPLSVAPGDMVWLYSSLKDAGNVGRSWRYRVNGSHLKLTALLDGRVIGRLWLPGGGVRPVMTGGSPDSFYVPGLWLAGKDGKLSLLLEAVDRSEAGRIESIIVEPV
ncbi:beta-galactosidase [Paenibacillus tarimensis]